ncbi:hypothetical protein ACKVMT_13920 [Halobacteriales archaeon Cl-PHB]
MVRNTHAERKLLGIGLLALAAVLTAALIGVAVTGGATAATNTTTLGNKTLDVDEDTEGVRVLVENTTGNLTAYVYGVDGDGNETEVANGTLYAPGDNETDTYEYRNINSTKYPEYRVEVTGEAVETLEIAKLQVVTGATGGILPSGATAPAAGALGVFVLVVLGFAAREFQG